MQIQNKINIGLLKHLTLWRAQCRMNKIINVLNKTDEDNDIPNKIHMEPWERYLCGIKYNSHGFIPYQSNVPIKQVRRCPPSYMNPYPINLINNIKKSDFNYKINCYTDGSSKPNPGRSSFAWIYTQTRNLNRYHNNTYQYSKLIPYPCSISSNC